MHHQTRELNLQNTHKILISSSSGILIGISSVLLVTLYAQPIALVLGCVMLLSGLTGIYLVKKYSKQYLLICLFIQALVGLGVFILTAVTNQHIFNMAWSLIVGSSCIYMLCILGSN